MNKFIIVFTMPSGIKFTASMSNGCFALSPIVNGYYYNALSFNSKWHAETFLVKLEQLAGPQKFAELEALNPTIEPIDSDDQRPDLRIV